ncbi:amidohydrolase family protein [Niabella ginsengisoli]|uniref:amidohydrolase family protein n=1 Tax=Niabella ginsengisoli TaxID=522298 RepID=UPI00374C99DB
MGRKKQQFDWENLSIKMTEGFYRDGNGNLGGAAISMIDAVKNAMQYLNILLQEAVEMSTSRVAKAIKMDKEIGYIKPGYNARFVLFDDEMKEVESLIF